MTGRDVETAARRAPGLRSRAGYGEAPARGQVPAGDTRGGHSRRAVLRGAAGLAAGVAAAGRGGRVGAQATPGTGSSPAATPVDGVIPSPAPGVPDAFVTLPPPYQAVPEPPGRGGTVTALLPSYVPPVPPRDENRFWQELERRVGATLDPDLVPSNQYGERIATALASGDLPDILWVDLATVPDLGDLIRQGAFTDLTDHLTGAALQEYPNLALIPAASWDVLTVEGRLWGIPRPRVRANGALVFRRDWAERTGTPRPETAEAFYELMVAFTQGDPDGNGQQDTWGIGRLAGGYFDQLYGAPNAWRLEPDGRLTHRVETDEFRRSVEFQRRMFDAGVFQPDPASYSTQQMKDRFVGGRFGSYNDGLFALPGSRGLRARARQANPAADVIGLVPFGHDGGAAVSHNGGGNAGFVTIPASAGDDEERLRELLRILNYFASPFGSTERIFLNFGLEGVHHTVQPDGGLALTEQGRFELGGEVRSDLASFMHEPPALYYPDAPGDAQYMQGLIADLVAIGIDDPTLGLYPAAAAELNPVLGQLIADQETAIVLGREGVDAIGPLAEEWRRRGGDEVRAAYQEALAAR